MGESHAGILPLSLLLSLTHAHTRTVPLPLVRPPHVHGHPCARPLFPGVARTGVGSASHAKHKKSMARNLMNSQFHVSFSLSLSQFKFFWSTVWEGMRGGLTGTVGGREHRGKRGDGCDLALLGLAVAVSSVQCHLLPPIAFSGEN